MLARFIVQWWPTLAEAIERKRTRVAHAERTATIHLLAEKAERRKAVGKQTEPHRYWGDDAS